MKKAEMIEIMIEMYRELEPNYPQYFTQKHAEAILARIEEKGMHPPSYWVKEGISSFPPDGLDCLITGWEPEVCPLIVAKIDETRR